MMILSKITIECFGRQTHLTSKKKKKKNITVGATFCDLSKEIDQSLKLGMYVDGKFYNFQSKKCPTRFSSLTQKFHWKRFFDQLRNDWDKLLDRITFLRISFQRKL
jgi:hypothetical protein